VKLPAQPIDDLVALPWAQGRPQSGRDVFDGTDLTTFERIEMSTEPAT
jgi:hypothetical protein